jgi:aspartate/methionine/tyrosine aminotransferase
MPLPPFALERYFARYEFDVDYVLCASDCESLTIAELLSLESGAADRFASHWLGYTESAGAPSLRREIARIYETVPDGDVLVHPGAEEAIYLFMLATLGPGDHAIVHVPCYQSLTEVACSTGCEVTPWIAREADGWALDPDDLGRLIRPNTRVVVINTPHNPTGYLMPRDAFEEVIRLADARGIVLFSDEVYRELEHDPGLRLPAAADRSELAVSLGVLSKTYGLPGLRIGWVATHNAAVRKRMAELKDYTTICSSAPSEFLAEVALRHRQTLAARNLEIVRGNLVRVGAFFDRHPDRFAWQAPLAGPIAFPRLVDDDVDAFCEGLVWQTRVLLLPGTLFGDGGNHFRIGFGRRNLPEALERLEAFVAQEEGTRRSR